MQSAIDYPAQPALRHRAALPSRAAPAAAPGYFVLQSGGHFLCAAPRHAGSVQSVLCFAAARSSRSKSKLRAVPFRRNRFLLPKR